MAKTRQQKEKVLKDVSSQLDEAKSMVLCSFDQLTVNDDQQLRADLKENDVKYQVVKKTLLKKAFAEKKIDGVSEDELGRNLGLATAGDEVVGAKLLSKFSDDREGFNILGGILEGAWIDSAKIAALAKLPSKEELIAKTVGTIKAPITGFVNVLGGNLRNLVNVLNNIKDNK